MAVVPHTSREGAWYIKISHGRHGKTEYIPFLGSREEALAYERQLRGLANVGDPGFLDHYAPFLLWYRNQSSPRGLEVITNSFKHLVPYFGAMRIRHITPMIIEQYKASRSQQVKRRTVDIELNGLSAYFRFLREQHHIQTPTIKRFGKKATAPPPKTPLTADELAALIAQVTDLKRRAIVTLMAANGLRKNEAMTLTGADVLDSHRAVIIHGKGGKYRIAAIEAHQLWDDLLALKALAGNGPLFVNAKTGRPYQRLERSIRSAAQRAGIAHERVTHHLLRHSIATALDTSGETTRAIQGILDHSEIATTEHYLHLNPERTRQTAARAASLLSLLENTEKT